ncbi:hypothetical protein MSBRM_0750 [Methanosarcina barkeri MS]|uniref:Uncharacterized protein n=1 Tax=Methanosarcina barkeri MS TaxID=1434108 RepID=A0A0E3QTA7_METBA|nr:hypothetical protein MSBRM_0750 [Methanosarcina barkeri MS]
MYLSKANLKPDIVTNKEFWKLSWNFGDNFTVLYGLYLQVTLINKGIFCTGRMKKTVFLYFIFCRSKNLKQM